MSSVKRKVESEGTRSTTHHNARKADKQRASALLAKTEDDTLLTHSQGIRVLQLRIAMIDFYPARLVSGKDRWYIVFYQTDPTDRKLKRHRDTFNIGRYPIEKRAAAAKEIIDSINARLPYGYPYDQDFYIREVSMTTPKAFELVTSVTTDLRHATKLSYASSMRKFIRFLDKIGMAAEDVTSINLKIAMAYSDDLTKNGISGRTHNNDIDEMKRVFNVLKSREIVTVNPFASVPKRREAEKKRRSLTKHETNIILPYLRDTDQSAYLSCALLYFCFIRPNEQRFIRCADIDLQNSIIYLHSDKTKNHKSCTVTIPDQLLEMLMDLGIQSLPGDRFIIGSANTIGHRKSVGKNTIGDRYRKAIRLLHAKGLLSNITGNSIYSWKDTGVTSLARSGINGIALKEQLRHHSLDESTTYISQSHGANDFIKTNHRLLLSP